MSNVKLSDYLQGMIYNGPLFVEMHDMALKQEMELYWLYQLFFDHVGTDAPNVDPEGYARVKGENAN